MVKFLNNKNMINDIEEEFDFEEIKKNLKNLKDVKKKFDNLLNSNLVTLEDNKNELMNVPHKLILSKLKDLDYDKLNNEQVSRVLLILNYLDDDILKEYSIYFNKNFPKKEIPKTPTKPNILYKENIKKYNTEISVYKNNILPMIEYYNTKIESVKDCFSRLVDNDLLGDIELNVDDMRYIYFMFFNLDKSYIKMFIKDLKSSRADSLHFIKKIDIIDIKNDDDRDIKYIYEVRLYFEKDKDIELLEKCRILFESNYTKYVQMSENMRLGLTEWGLDIMKNGK